MSTIMLTRTYALVANSQSKISMQQQHFEIVTFYFILPEVPKSLLQKVWQNDFNTLLWLTKLML